MRAWPLALLALLMLPHAAAPPPAIEEGETYVARITRGEMPADYAVDEPATGWNVVEYLRFDHDGSQQRIPLATSRGNVFNVSCACGNVSLDGPGIVIGDDVEAGRHLLVLGRNIDSGDAFLADLALFRGQGRLVAYIPPDAHVDTTLMQRGAISCSPAFGPCTIQTYDAGSGHFAVLPGAAPSVPGDDEVIDWMSVAIGIIAGILLWAYLVQRGLVQKRRRQQVQQAAHVSAAAEGKEGLTARKRILMAGLKELETAKMNKDIDSAVYDKLKAELKKETVTVMRALEQSE